MLPPKKPLAKKKYSKPSGDSLAEDIFEFLDPTGISSYDDVYRSYKKNGLLSVDTGIEILGALPLVGKAGKILKGATRVNKVLNKINKVNKVVSRSEKIIPKVLSAGTSLSKDIAKVSKGGKTNPIGALAKVSGKVGDKLIKVEKTVSKTTGKVVDKAIKKFPEKEELVRTTAATLNTLNTASSAVQLIPEKKEKLIPKVVYYNTNSKHGDIETPKEEDGVIYTPISNSAQLEKWKNQKGMAKKKVTPRKKYALGTSGVSVKNYLQSPREALAKNDILMSKAELEAQTNPLAMGVEMGTQVLSQLASSGALIKQNKAPEIDTSKTIEFMTPEQQFAFESQRTVAAMGNPGIPAGEVELEGDEVIQTPNGQVAELKGPSHEQGGIPMEVGNPNSALTLDSVPEDSEAFSKRVFKGGKNMADRKMSRERTKESLLSLLDTNKSDIAIKNTVNRKMANLEREEEEDLAFQEMASLFSQVQEFAYGTGRKGIKKYAGGTNGIQDPTKPWRLSFSTQADRPMEPGEIALAEGIAAEKKYLAAINGTNEVFNNEANQTASVNTSLVKTKEVNDIAAQALTEKKGEFTPRYGAPSKFYGKVNSTSFDPIAKSYINSNPSINNLDFSDVENVKDLQKWIYGKEDGPEIDGMIGPDTIAKGIARQNGISPSGELMPEVKSIFESIPGLTPGTNPIPTVGGISNTFIGPDGVPVTIGSTNKATTTKEVPTSSTPGINGEEESKRKGYVPTAGDLLTLAGTAYSAFAPMANTLENRAGDTPNVNEYKDFGKESLDTLARAAGFLTQERDNSNRKVASASRGAKKSGRAGARGINQVRAMDLATDINTTNAQADIDTAFANKTLGLLGQKANLQNTIDQVVMGGEKAADLADREDRDNFYTQLGKDKASKGEGIQQLGKNVNTMLQNPILMNLLENMGEYVGMNAKGEYVAKQMKTKKNNNTKTTEETSAEEIAFEKDMLAKGYKKDSKGNWIKN